MASPGGFFGAQPGGSTTPPTSLTPYSGSPGKIQSLILGLLWILLGILEILQGTFKSSTLDPFEQSFKQEIKK
jgi:hypothetical protein